MIAILQARLKSTRLPGKALFTFFGQNMLERAISIAREIDQVERVVLATGDCEENQVFKRYVENAGAEFWVGSEDNVLQRFCEVIASYDGEYCLRMTCDNYLIQPDVIEGLYLEAKQSEADYAYISPLSHFSGEIIRCETLVDCYQRGYSAEAKEHVSWDIRNSTKANIVTASPDFLGLNHTSKITLDTLEDLIEMKRLESEHPGLEQIRCLETLKSVIAQQQQ